jgi:hypothetical protein
VCVCVCVCVNVRACVFLTLARLSTARCVRVIVGFNAFSTIKSLQYNASIHCNNCINTLQ